MTKIIGMSGNSGSGKTTLAKALAKELAATVLHWDDFDEISKGPNDYIDWYQRGENYQEWDYPALATVLKELKKGNDLVFHPTTKEQLRNSSFVIFDAPLGRFHQQTGQYIDFWIHLGTPLDVSLARRLVRDFYDSEKTKEDLLKDLEIYLTLARPLFLDDDYKLKADLVIDGLFSLDAQIKVIKNSLNQY